MSHGALFFFFKSLRLMNRRYSACGIDLARSARNARACLDRALHRATLFYGAADLDLPLLQVQATDPDCGVNAMVNYTLGSDGLESEQLLVHSETGDICVQRPLDRETAPYLELPVIATDRGMCRRNYYCCHTHVTSLHQRVISLVILLEDIFVITTVVALIRIIANTELMRYLRQVTYLLERNATANVPVVIALF